MTKKTPPKKVSWTCCHCRRVFNTTEDKLKELKEVHLRQSHAPKT